MTRTPILPILLVSVALFLSGCAGQPASETRPEPSDTVSEQTPLSQTDTEQRSAQGSFPPSTLYALLVAEIAGQRGMPQITLSNYLHEARKTRDLGITQRALEVARHLRHGDALLEATTLWSELEPDNINPLQMRASELVRQNRHEEALPVFSQLIRKDGSDAMEYLASQEEKLTPADRQAYLDMLDQLLNEQPEAAILYFGKAALLRNTDRVQALALITQSLSLEPEHVAAIMLEAELQNSNGHIDTAIGHLRQELNKRDHKQMRSLYTRLLLEKGLFTQAKEQADLLLSRHSGDHNLGFYLAVLMLEHDQLDSSESYLLRLTEQLGENSAMHYYLGRIAQQRNQVDKAIEHFSAADNDTYLVAGHSEIIKLLDENEQYPRIRNLFNAARDKNPKQAPTLYALEANWLLERDRHKEAMSLYDNALDEHPKDVRLLYNRAMLAEMQGNLVQMEHDLRLLLEIEPDNATALNALGYSLTDHTDRHTEALALIQRALELKPEDPAILDSLGWAHYNLGQLEQAHRYLKQAYDSFPDPEIATHLGKTLWRMGRTQEATDIWNNALQRDPDSDMVKQAIEDAQKEQ